MQAVMYEGLPGPQYTQRVWYAGTDEVQEGYALCYNSDTGTAASVDQNRGAYVEVPSTSNNYWFAGVADKTYAANAAGQYITIYRPGSYCNVYGAVNATVGTTRMTFCAGQDYFYTAGFPGIGTALALQTIDRSTTAGLIFARLETGPQSGGVERVTPTAGAITLMVGGVSYLAAATIASNATATLADGTFFGQQKAVILDGAMTTSDVVVTVTTVYEGAGSDTCTMDTTAEYLWALWQGKAWHVLGSVLS